MTTIDTIRLDQLDARIRSVWGRGQMLHLLAGAMALLRWAVPMFLVGVFIDWMTYMPAGGRWVILLVLVGVPLFRAWRCGWRHLRPFNAVHTALQIEACHAGLGSLLVSAIQLRDHATAGGGSGALRDHTCRLAEQAASAVRPDQAVPYRPLRQPAALALTLCLVLGGFAAVNGPFFAAGVQRLFTPWVDIEYPTDTQIALGDKELVIKEGDSAQITASIGGVVPDRATIFVKTGEGKARAIDLDIQNDRFEYNIASASRDFTYRIKAGDDRTGWHKVRVVPAPRIEAVNVEQRFPDYLGRSNESVEALTLTVPEGTHVDWRLKLDRPVRSAQFVRDEQPAIDLKVSDDGRVVTFNEQVSASRGYSFAWVDREHGFEFTSPRYYLQVSSDQAPRVELTSPGGNLVAMIGRPVNLTVRAQDDHGIGVMSVAYRVNQRDETHVELPEPVQSGGGDQPIDWDYRAALPDLAIGDTVSFTVLASDKYPGPAGPHVVRSETRRITFLSKEQYLEQIEKQKDRLLSRVQAIYRQQRSAHEAVRILSPDNAGFAQACQLEAIRQEMIREDLKAVAGQMRALLDDLAANGVADAAEGDALEAVRTALIAIADEHIANAATLLREQSGTAQDSKRSANPARAALAVNTAARGLAALVLLRGIESAQEVFARETRMLAQEQALLRWSATEGDSADRAEALGEQQAQLAQWTEQLTAELQAGMRFDKRPLAVLRLIRSVKDLRDAQAAVRMREAGELIRQGKADQAAAVQGGVVRTLLDAEFSVRLSGAYSTLLKTRDTIAFLASAQVQLREQAAAIPAEAFTSQRSQIVGVQSRLHQQLLTMLLPTIPAPRAQLFDESQPQTPPVETLLAQVDKAMAGARADLAGGKREDAAAKQRQAEQALAELFEIVDRWSVELGIQTQGLSTLVAATSERLSRLEEYEARTIGMLEKTDIAAAEEKKVEVLAESQSILADELAGFKAGLEKQHRLQPDPDLPPVLTRLERAVGALNDAARSLKANAANAAIGQQEAAADAIAEAYAIVLAQNERLGLLQDLMMFQRSVGFANGYMADIVAEQRDLLDETRGSEPKAMSAMLPRFAHMRDCMVEVAPLLDLVAARLDVGTPLVFAKTDFEDAMASIEIGDKFDAMDAQDVAAESLGEVQLLVQAIRSQTGYVAEIVSFLHASVSDAETLGHEQQVLQHQAEQLKQGDPQQLAQQQRALLARSEEHARLLVSATGMPEFAEAVMPMRDVLVKLEAGDVSAAAGQMALASQAYADSNELLLAVITMLHGLPSIEITNQTEPDLVRLVDVLAVASSHKQVFRQTPAADAQTLKALAKQQRELATRCEELAAAGESNPLLDAANKSLAQAAAAFESSDQDALRRHQRDADEKLRQFVVEQALILETAVPPPVSSDLPAADGPGSDTESEFAAGFIADFVSGEAPQDKETEWKLLADRDRAALNQNFARELPLEYRALLKNYYERVAE